MKASTLIIVMFGLLAASCSTYLSVTENNTEQIQQKLNDYERDDQLGAEVILTIKSGGEISGELLSIRESSVTTCMEFSATEKELASLKYSINTVRNDEIKEFTIKGGWYIWSGMGYGALGGAAIGAISFYAFSKNSTHLTKGTKTLIGGVLGTLVGAITGGVVGYFLSTDDLILQEIPPGYDMSFLKPLARYPDEEPEYLKAIH